MLNKEICKQCYKDNCMIWDDECWSGDFVYCPGKYMTYRRDVGNPHVKGKIPKYCPYQLEHLMKEQENAE